LVRHYGVVLNIFEVLKNIKFLAQDPKGIAFRFTEKLLFTGKHAEDPYFIPMKLILLLG
jgi:hypothetical protein